MPMVANDVICNLSNSQRQLFGDYRSILKAVALFVLYILTLKCQTPFRKVPFLSV